MSSNNIQRKKNLKRSPQNVKEKKILNRQKLQINRHDKANEN